MVSMTGVAGADSPAVQADRHRMEGKAREVFKQADADHSGTLDRAEQLDADVRAEEEIQNQLKKHRIILPAVPEPKLADREAMTEHEFIQHFESRAGRMDATVRTHNIANRRPQTGGAPSPPQVPGTNPGPGEAERGRDVEEDSQEGVHRIFPDKQGPESISPKEDVPKTGGNPSKPPSGGPTVEPKPGGSVQKEPPRNPSRGENGNEGNRNRGGGIEKPPPKEPKRDVPSEKQLFKENTEKHKDTEKPHKDKDKEKERGGRTGR
jgi:hypothetical protein